MTREDMARVCMENYDPDFGSVAKPGDILVAGMGFGAGSSREQAATALLARDIPLRVLGQSQTTRSFAWSGSSTYALEVFGIDVALHDNPADLLLHIGVIPKQRLVK